MDSYGTDHIKAKARDEIYADADAWMPAERSRASAVYLAGANSKESELLDRLGIPRQNRIILEHNPQKVRSVKKANPGITVLPMSTHDFFQHECSKHKPFWYIGLDYECKLNPAVVQDLRAISQHNALIEEGILYTNLVGTRENDNLKEEYLESMLYRNREFFNKAFRNEMRDAERKLSMHGESPVEHEVMAHMVRSLPRKKLVLLRGFAVSSSVQSALLNSSMRLFFMDIYSPGSSAVLGFSDPVIYESASPEQARDDNGQARVSFDSLPLAVLFGNMEHNNALIEENPKLYGLAEKIEGRALQYYLKGGLEIIPMLFQFSKATGYLASERASFAYTSTRNTPMLLDALQVRKADATFKRTMKALKEVNLRVLYGSRRPFLARSNVRIGAQDSSQEKVMRELADESEHHVRDLLNSAQGIEQWCTSRPRRELYARKHLGSAHRQPLTLNIARQLIIQNMSDEDIDAHYLVSKAGWRRVAALRANHTRERIKRKPERNKDNGQA
ncbi:hypothetical protein HYZ97_03150 [Candidatus Pacearchaeota archaeon]|nr:hypothetical protein [Candidatus Pacearchaeota archaeon]